MCASPSEYLERLLASLAVSGERVLVSYSGGKDSTYALKLLTEAGVEAIAYLVDNSFIADQAMVNARVVCERLNVRLVIDRLPPKVIRQDFETALRGRFFGEAQIRRASDICNVCMHYINQSVIRFALGNGIRYLSGGYVGGQVPRTGCLSKISLELYAVTMQTLEEQLHGHGGPALVSSCEFLYALNPLVALEVAEELILREISELGWEMPLNTGMNSSNCMINDYAITRHLAKYGIHPYGLELESRVRRGLLTEEEARRRLTGGNVNPRDPGLGGGG